MTTGWAAAEKAARNSYGRLLAWLTWQWRDIAAAEDALAEAFATALQRWPADGVPTHPDAWLLRVAQRCLLMDARRQRLASDPAVSALLAHDGKFGSVTAIVPDHRLRLMFICTHPAIDPAIRSALILQVVLGLDAQTIASAFLVKPEAMTKRLVRAKTKIRMHPNGRRGCRMYLKQSTAPTLADGIRKTARLSDSSLRKPCSSPNWYPRSCLKNQRR